MATAELAKLDADSTEPWPEPEGLYEVVGGKVVEKAMGAEEGRIAFKLGRMLGNFIEANGLGETFVEVLFLTIPATGQRRRPDVAFLSAERWPSERDPEGVSYPIAPGLAVEVVSPSDLADDLNVKIREYFAAGVRQVWVIYRTTATIDVHDSPTTARTLTRADTLDGGPVIPGFRMPVSDLLREPKPPAPAEPA